MSYVKVLSVDTVWCNFHISWPCPSDRRRSVFIRSALDIKPLFPGMCMMKITMFHLPWCCWYSLKINMKLSFLVVCTL